DRCGILREEQVQRDMRAFYVTSMLRAPEERKTRNGGLNSIFIIKAIDSNYNLYIHRHDRQREASSLYGRVFCIPWEFSGRNSSYEDMEVVRADLVGRFHAI